MTAKDLISELCNGISLWNEMTCDTIKAGDPDKEVHKVVTTMFATVDLIRRAKEWGADMIIVHEPTYYDHMEVRRGYSPVVEEKEALLESTGMVVYRYHDHPHHMTYDMITEGQLKSVGLKGTVSPTEFGASYIFDSEEPITALELAKRFETMTGIAHVKMVGELDHPATRIAACFGTPGGIMELLSREDVELMCIGEIVEWRVGEYVRDSAALGHHKALLVLGHIGSERQGMKLLAERLSRKHKDLTVEYMECGEVYCYTDDAGL